MNVGIISNPLSERNKRRGSRIAVASRGVPNLVHRELSTIDDIRPIIAEYAAREIGILALDGGDGTIQAALSEMLNNGPFERAPVLAVIPSGMTNAVATDVGLSGSPEKARARLRHAARLEPGALTTAERGVIRMTCDPALPPVYGMLFGLGAFYRAIMLCRRSVHPMGMRSSLALGATIAGLLARRMLSGDREDEVFRGDMIEVGWDNAEYHAGLHLMMLASTLRRFALGIRPFWGNGPGGLRVTDVAYPARHFGRSLIPILCSGKPPLTNGEDYVSRNVERIQLGMSCPFTLDGQLFEPVPGMPVTLESGPTIRFLR